MNIFKQCKVEGCWTI